MHIGQVLDHLWVDVVSGENLTLASLGLDILSVFPWFGKSEERFPAIKSSGKVASDQVRLFYSF